MAPVTPFIVEHMFQNLKRIAPKAQRVDSVHYLMMPQPIEVGQSCIISGTRPNQQTKDAIFVMTQRVFRKPAECRCVFATQFVSEVSGQRWVN